MKISNGLQIDVLDSDTVNIVFDNLVFQACSNCRKDRVTSAI